MTKQSTHLIECRHLYKQYTMGDKTFDALKDVNLIVDRGEYVAILGPSGSGKSTLMSILGCLDEPSQGDYFFDGASITNLSKDQLAEVRNFKIGFIFQNFHLLPHVSALDNVALPLLFRGVNIRERREKAKQWLAQLGLGDRVDHLPSQLSGGQQQRVAIARALVTDPDLILADEPTGNLDSQSSDDVMHLFEDFLAKAPEKSLMMVTHNVELAQQTKRILHVKDGLVAE